MKNIGEVLICLTIPLQISLMPGIILSDGPFCYWDSEYYTEKERNAPLTGGIGVGPDTIECSWEIGAFFVSLWVLPVTIMTMPIVLNVFLIHFVKNYRKV